MKLSLIIKFFIVISWLFASVAHAANEQIDKLTVAYLFQISKFTSWDPSAFGPDTSTIRFCLYQDKANEFTPLFQQLSKRQSKDKLIDTHISNKQQTLLTDIQSGKRTCHILFWMDENWLKLSEAQKQLTVTDRLLIGTDAEFLMSGGMMAFIPSEQKLAIYINPDTLKNSRVKLESRLMAVAKPIFSREK